MAVFSYKKKALPLRLTVSTVSVKQKGCLCENLLHF